MMCMDQLQMMTISWRGEWKIESIITEWPREKKKVEKEESDIVGCEKEETVREDEAISRQGKCAQGKIKYWLC